MRTQIVHKAPKWSIQGKRSEPSLGPAPGPQSPVNVDKVKYFREPAYSFGNAPAKDLGGSGGAEQRANSAPAGPRGAPPLGPTTPLYSFGTTKREMPFAISPGPGPGSHHPWGSDKDGRGGPKYSIKGRPTSKAVQDGGPGPCSYRPRPPSPIGRGQIMAHSDRSPKMSRSRSAIGPGPSVVHMPFSSSAKYSMGLRLPEKVDISGRPLGPPFTHFGYDDHGHSKCYNKRDMHLC